MRGTMSTIVALALLYVPPALAQDAINENPNDLQRYDDFGSWQKILDQREIEDQAPRISAPFVSDGYCCLRSFMPVCQPNLSGRGRWRDGNGRPVRDFDWT